MRPWRGCLHILQRRSMLRNRRMGRIEASYRPRKSVLPAKFSLPVLYAGFLDKRSEQ